MEKALGLLDIVIGVVVFLAGSGSSEIPCARISFPTLHSPFITEAENTFVTFPFTISSEENCHLLEHRQLALQVIKQNSKTEILCQSFHQGRKCQQSILASSCNCSEDSGLYQFIRTVDRTDNTTWKWSANSPFVEDATLTFNILYPPLVLNLTLSGPDGQLPSNVDPNTTVDVLCSWENGNPPVTARLLDSHGVEMKDSIYSSGQIRYRFPAVGCQDAGLIRCEAPGARHNKTAALVVRCPPMFVAGKERLVVTLGRAELKFLVRSHTHEYRNCRLRKVLLPTKAGKPKTPADDELDKTTAASECISLSGTPPDLTLTVRLDNVKKEDEGQWRLELTNDAGTGHVDFDLIVTEGSDEDGSGDSNSGLSGSDLTVVVVGANVAVFTSLTIIAVIVVCVIRSRRGRTSSEQSVVLVDQVALLPSSPASLLLPPTPTFPLSRHLSLPPPPPPCNRRLRPAPACGSLRNEHIYEEIDGARTHPKRRTRSRSRVSRYPDLQPSHTLATITDDYIHAVPTQPDKLRTLSTGDILPWCEKRTSPTIEERRHTFGHWSYLESHV